MGILNAEPSFERGGGRHLTGWINVVWWVRTWWLASSFRARRAYCPARWSVVMGEVDVPTIQLGLKVVVRRGFDRRALKALDLLLVPAFAPTQNVSGSARSQIICALELKQKGEDGRPRNGTAQISGECTDEKEHESKQCQGVSEREEASQAQIQELQVAQRSVLYETASVGSMDTFPYHKDVKKKSPSATDCVNWNDHKPECLQARGTVEQKHMGFRQLAHQPDVEANFEGQDYLEEDDPAKLYKTSLNRKCMTGCPGQNPGGHAWSYMVIRGHAWPYMVTR
ncbi:hypothetical protein DFH07DRAFT_764508 [Mycena maculata]|uniref:Uncharacterized protein n=1 Tax=Mycena maculata TaxID=230809 RepID=A0AAD7KBN7_9AGAR|nr:hypothetical protein DFH07DRAFT_764508 [Mycena maculata]